jgi:hypothetical protein
MRWSHEERPAQIFYLMMLIILSFLWSDLFSLSKDGPAVRWLWPVSWMQFCTDTLRFQITISIFLTTFFFVVFAALRPSSRTLRIAVALLFFQTSALRFSYATNTYYTLNWITIGFFLAIPRDWKSGSILKVRNWACNFFFVMYLSAGLWKLRMLFADSGQWSFIEALSRALPYNIAYAVAKGTHEGVPVGAFFQAHLNLSILAWIVVIFYELSSAIPILMQKYFRIWGLAFILFHVALKITLGVGFEMNALLVLLVFFIWPNESEA